MHIPPVLLEAAEQCYSWRGCTWWEFIASLILYPIGLSLFTPKKKEADDEPDE
ncbi:MAG: hypothetical protein WBA10_01295 [Elainellaceae cyanobacterium]